jgi:hypothetical protein
VSRRARSSVDDLTPPSAVVATQLATVLSWWRGHPYDEVADDPGTVADGGRQGGELTRQRATYTVFEDSAAV